MNATITFPQPYENFFNSQTGFLPFATINNSLTIMVVTTDGWDPRYGQIYYYTRPTSSDAWSSKIQIFGIPVSGMRWSTASMNADGSKLVVIGYGTPPYTFKLINGVYVFQGTISFPPNVSVTTAAINMTSDGLRIVITTINDYTYYSTWNNSTNNYNTLIQTLDTTLRNQSNNLFGNLAMSSNGSRIAFCNYDAQNVPSFIFADWDGSNYGPYTAIPALNGHLNTCCGGALTPDGGCLIINAQQPMYGYFNNGNFTSFVNVPSTVIPPMLGMYYINIFYMTHDGLHLIWNVNRDDMNIKMISIEYSTPSLYLGDNITIHNADVRFNNSNVFIKDPVEGLHGVNKQYVDLRNEEINTLILANENTDTTSTTLYYDLIAERQEDQNNLATQVNNLYQYFFNASRTDAVLF